MQQQQQQEERDALQSIYGPDFALKKPTTVWKGASALPEFDIRLKHAEPALAQRVDTFLPLGNAVILLNVSVAPPLPFPLSYTEWASNGFPLL